LHPCTVNSLHSSSLATRHHSFRARPPACVYPSTTPVFGSMCCDLTQQIQTSGDFSVSSDLRAQIAACHSWRAIRSALPTPQPEPLDKPSSEIIDNLRLPSFAIYLSLARGHEVFRDTSRRIRPEVLQVAWPRCDCYDPPRPACAGDFIACRLTAGHSACTYSPFGVFAFFDCVAVPRGRRDMLHESARGSADRVTSL
jgi:hypothetical protein